MSRLPSLLTAGLLWSVLSLRLGAQDVLPLSHNPSDFQYWGMPVEGLTAAVHLKPFSAPRAWPDGFRFQVLVKNDSTKPWYVFSSGGRHGAVTMKILDDSGRAVSLREATSESNQPPMLVPVGGHYFADVFLWEIEFKAIEGNRLVATINLYDKPSKTAPEVHSVGVETAPFQICPSAPVQASLPDDPMMVQWKQKEAQLLDQLNMASTPGDRSSAAETLAYHYIDCYGDFDKARALLPQMNSDESFETKVILVTRNIHLTAQQKAEGLQALRPDCPPEREKQLDELLSTFRYAAEHSAQP